MKKIPHFAGKNSLSLTDLQALADAVPPPCTHVQPATATRGRVQYDNADYNLATLAADECSGTAARPDSPGMLATVAYATADAPYIDAGNLVLPLAHDLDPADDSSEPTALVAGGLYRVDAVEGIKRPQINRGAMQLPFAQSAWPQTAEGAMYTPGFVYGVQYDPVDDACEGAVLPRIDQGIIHLPAGGGGGGDDTEPTGCSCVPAQYTGSISSLGLIRSVAFEENLESCLITNGRIRLPLAHSDWPQTAEGAMYTPGLVYGVQYDNADACEGSVLPRIDQGIIHLPAGSGGGGGEVSGVVNTSGEQVTWAQMQAAPVRLAVFFLDGYRLYLTGQLVNGFLQFNTEAV